MSKKTIENLKEAFAGESQARNKYTFFARKAREEGLEQAAKIFEEGARNEEIHAKIIFNLLSGIGTTKENLKVSIEGETHEFTEMYPKFLEEAKAEGEIEAAKYFETVITAEKDHARKYEKLLAELEGNVLVAEEKSETKWRCQVCGYVYTGEQPPEVCPLCGAPKEAFEKID